jgi:proline iminopeptidase
MTLEVGGTELWYDIEGPSRDEPGRPTVVLLHGGPGGFDHSYFRPDFSRLTSISRVVYLDLPDHGRSHWGPPEDWTFEHAGELIHGFCEALKIEKPVVLGHSFGGLVAIEYAARHPEHPAGLILQSTFAWFDLDRLVRGFRAIGGDEIARIVRRSYEQDPTVTADEWERCWELFGPWVPSADERARMPRNQAFNEVGGRLMLEVDLRPRLAAIRCPTLVSVGRLDPITPVWAADEIVAGLGGTHPWLDVIEGAGHFPWRDQPDHYWSSIERFVGAVSA